MILLLLCINVYAHAVRNQSALGQGPGDVEVCTYKVRFYDNYSILVNVNIVDNYVFCILRYTLEILNVISVHLTRVLAIYIAS